jgi:thioredoxin-related protein
VGDIRGSSGENKTEPRKIFMDMYTHWCGWCKKMDASTFKDPKVVDYLNKKYYAVKFDAETKDTIKFRDHDFFFHADKRSNELAFSLMQGKMSYPTTLYLDETFALLSPVPGYITTDQIMPILTYFGDNIYKTQKWEEFLATLNKDKGGVEGK